MTAVEVRVPSVLGEHKVQMTSLAMIERHLQIESCRMWQLRRLRNAVGDRVGAGLEKWHYAACDALLDARLDWIEADMARLVDAWPPMPDFRDLVVGQHEEVAA